MRLVAIAVLAAVAVFFGRDVWQAARVRRQIDALRRERTELRRSIESDSLLLRRLDDPEFLERYARERFLMRRDSETVYILMK